MPEAVNISYDPNCVHCDSTEANKSAMRGPLITDELGICLPTGRVTGGILNSEDAGPSIMMALLAPTQPFGLFVAWSPEGARIFARQLNEMADRVERQIAEQAAAAIDRARRAPGQ